MRRSPALVRTPQRQLPVTCEGGSRLAVGRRPGVVQAEAEPAATPWSRGLWGVFLPERRKQPVARPEGQPERRQAA